MTQTYVEQSRTIYAPPCENCRQPTRIYGIEPHLRLPNADVHTYVCDACDLTQVVTLPRLS